MSNQYKLCEICVIRHCNRSPIRVSNKVGANFKCAKFRKHQTGYKFSELQHEKMSQIRVKRPADSVPIYAEGYQLIGYRKEVCHGKKTQMSKV